MVQMPREYLRKYQKLLSGNKKRKDELFDRSYVTGNLRYSFQQFKILTRQLINTRYQIRNFWYQNTVALGRCHAGLHGLLKVSHCRILCHIINHQSVLVHQKFNICPELRVFILNSFHFIFVPFKMTQCHF